MFGKKDINKSVPKTDESLPPLGNIQKETNKDRKPLIPNIGDDFISRMQDQKLHSIPDDIQPTDLFNKMIQMDVNLLQEDKARKKKLQIFNKNIYKENLDTMLQDKKKMEYSHVLEEKIWQKQEEEMMQN